MNLNVQDFVVPGHDADEIDFAHAATVAGAFTRLLRQLDDKLFCFWAREDSTAFENPGRWHIGRLHSNPELNTYWVCQTSEGGYREPNESDLEWLRRHDTFARNVYEDMCERRSTRQIEKDKRFQEVRREFRERLAERLEHNYTSSILVPRAAADAPVPKHRELVLPPGARVDRP